MILHNALVIIFMMDGEVIVEWWQEFGCWVDWGRNREK